MKLYLLHYQNYYNRIVDRPRELGFYAGYMCYSSTIGDNNPADATNFVPGDGVFTQQLINWHGEHPDYVIAVSNTGIIESRWYVVESTRTRGGQYQLSLFRDLFADYYEQIMKAPAFIEKGYVNTSDSAIFNAESMTFNQIKKQEFLLKDKTKCAWIVGYVASSETNVPIGETIKFGGIPQIDFEVAEIEDWKYYSAYEKEQALLDKDTLQYTVYANQVDPDGDLTDDVYATTFSTTKSTYEKLEDYESATSYKILDHITDLTRYRATENTNNIAVSQFGYTEPYTTKELKALQNQYIKTGTGETARYWQISVSTDEGIAVEKTITRNSNLGKELAGIIANGVEDGKGANVKPITGNGNDDSFIATFSIDIVAINLKVIDVESGFTMSLAGDRPTLNDAPYCMFCIPFGENYKIKTADGTVDISQFNSLTLANGIATSLGGLGENSKIYDLQLLPYCPIPLVREAGPTLDLTDAGITDNIYYDYHAPSHTIMYWATDSSGSFDITYNYYTKADSPIEFKIDALTKFHRLCSPNYNGAFEFSPEKNGGIRSINVDYTYKPFQPYIHLNPNFGRLYGKDFDDVRGLVLGGDFSLPVVLDNWVNYQIQNKNYQAMFDRQIQSLETTNYVARKKEGVQMVSGTFSGAVSGATTGAMVGSVVPGVGTVVGAIGGAVVGGFSSALGGSADKRYNEILRNDALDYTKDQFGYELQNIQALPNALTKISAFNANNKIFPFIERYTATPEEETALRNKLMYNGMSIGRIGTLEEYYNKKPASMNGDYGYFKGQLIRIDGIYDDSHVVNAIAQEYNKGWYMI